MSLAFTRYKAKIPVVLQLIVFLTKSLALNEDLKIEKDIAESPNDKKNKSSLESEVSW